MSKRPALLLMGGGAVVGGLALILTSPAGEPSLVGRVQDAFGYGGPHTDTPNHGRNLFHSEVDISGIKGGLTYAQFNSRRIANAVDGFSGFGCLESCAAHEDGFRWAARHGVSKASECMGRSWSEVEGCAAFVSLKNDPEGTEALRRGAGLAGSK